MKDNILEVKDLKTFFGTTKAVDGVTFSVKRGTIFGIIGQSGSGKTLTALSIVRLIPPQARIVSGEVIFNGISILDLDEERLRGIRGARISFVFQEPSTALNPVFTIGYQLMEALSAHRRDISRPDLMKKAMEYLEKVHINDPKKVFLDYPHQLSGGTKQRAMIAMALINSPELVILDEPTTALDVTVQAQILGLLEEIRDRERLTMLFISHDFGIISRMCDEVAVMNRGRIVESAPTREIFYNPKDPYTASLLESVKALT